MEVKNMNVLKKRSVPFLLVCVLVLAMATPAFASGRYEDYTNVTAGNTSTVISGSYVAADIDVVVPTTGQAFINPYALPIRLSEITTPGELGASEASLSSIQNQQIVTQPMFIQNKSEVELSVSANVTGVINSAAANAANGLDEVSSGVIFGTAAPAASVKNKTVFTYLQMEIAPTLTASSTAGDLIKTFTGWTNDSYNRDKDLVVATKTATKESMVVLAAGSETGTAGEREATAGGIAMFRLAGKVVTDPTGGWQDTDTFKVTIAFSFKPDPAKATLGTYDNTTLTSTSGSITLNVGVSGATGVKASNVQWTATTPGDIGSVVTITYDEVAYAYVLKPVSTLSSSTNQVVEVIAVVTATNGKTYRSDPLPITISIP